MHFVFINCRVTSSDADFAENSISSVTGMAVCGILTSVACGVLSNVIHHQVIEKEKQTKTVYNKHRNTTDMLDYQAIARV